MNVNTHIWWLHTWYMYCLVCLNPLFPFPSFPLLFLRLRTLSSGGGNKNSSSGGGKSGGGGEGGIHSPLKHSQSHNSFVSPVKQPPSSSTFSGLPGTPTTSTKKFPLAKHRYGKEELLQLFSDDVQRPSTLPHLTPLTRTQLLTPLSFMPLSEEEQVSFSDNYARSTLQLTLHEIRTPAFVYLLHRTYETLLGK